MEYKIGNIVLFIKYGKVIISKIEKYNGGGGNKYLKNYYTLSSYPINALPGLSERSFYLSKKTFFTEARKWIPINVINGKWKDGEMA